MLAGETRTEKAAKKTAAAAAKAKAKAKAKAGKAKAAAGGGADGKASVAADDEDDDPDLAFTKDGARLGLRQPAALSPSCCISDRPCRVCLLLT